MKFPLIPSLIVLFLPSVSLAQTSIGVNFSSDRATAELAADDEAGVVPKSNWNNFLDVPSDVQEDTMGETSEIVSPNEGELTQDDGTVLAGTTIEWTSRNAWNTGNGEDTPDNALMNGYLDTNGGTQEIVIDVAGIPASYTSGGGYSVIAYFGSDGNGRTGTIEVTGGETYSFSTFSQQAGDFPEAYVQTEDTADGNPEANYARWDGVTAADLTITLNRGSSNSGIHGFQIIKELDTDGDGLPNEWEEANGLDPNDNGDTEADNGANGDPDGDELSNIAEFARGSDPRKADTDGDSLSDLVETATGVFVSATDTGSSPIADDTDGDTLKDGDEVAANPFMTDPNLADTDGDTLSDAEELAGDPATDPTKEDTDGDTFSDAIEIRLGTDPTDATSFPQDAGGVGSIGFNFSADRAEAEIAADEEAGVVPMIGWNNFLDVPSSVSEDTMRSTTDISGPLEGIVSQDDGSPLGGVTIEWTSRNAWNTNNGEEGGDNKLMNGYIDNNAGTPEITVDVAGIPYASYDVLAYFGSDGNDRTGSIGVDGYETFFYSTFSQLDGDFPDSYEQTTDTEEENPQANYAMWEAVEGESLSILLTRGSSNSGIHGVQIIGRGAAAAFEITDLSRDATTGAVDVTWRSKDGETYAVETSPDLETWAELDDGVLSAGDETTFTDPEPENAAEFYYRIRRQEG